MTATVSSVRTDGPRFRDHAFAWRARYGLWLLIAALAFVVGPPFMFLVEQSLTLESGGEVSFTLLHYGDVFALGRATLWQVSLIYALGSSGMAIAIGATSAWLVARTDAPFRPFATMAAYLSLSAPVIVKGIGWILLLGPNKGIINEWLRGLFAIEGVPVAIFTLTGMTVLEAVLWVPVVFLLLLPAFGAMDPALEEAATMAGASFPRTLARVTLRLALPSILAVLLLTFIHSIESFEIPYLVGGPANLQTFTTAIYERVYRGFLPRYGEASAYAVLLVAIVTLPLIGYYRVTRRAQRFITVTGKGFRPARISLGRWRLPAGLYLLMMPVALLAPFLILLWTSFLPIYEPPSLADLGKLSLQNYYLVLTRENTLAGAWNAVLVASVSSTLATLFTLALAFVVVRRREPERWLLDVLASLPLVLPGIVLGTALLIEFLYLRVVPIYGTLWIVVLAFVIRSLPYGIRFNVAGVISVHVHLEECARTCGAGTLILFRRIVLPLVMPAVAAIWIYVFLSAIRDLSLPIMLAGSQNRLIAVVILDLWNEGNVPQVGALSVLLAVAATALGSAFMALTRRFGAAPF